ncbi:MAG: hypothetical protein Q9185_002880 [Variospora sp. 1 TL-2023]
MQTTPHPTPPLRPPAKRSDNEEAAPRKTTVPFLVPAPPPPTTRVVLVADDAPAMGEEEEDSSPALTVVDMDEAIMEFAIPSSPWLWFSARDESEPEPTTPVLPAGVKAITIPIPDDDDRVRTGIVAE